MSTTTVPATSADQVGESQFGTHLLLLLGEPFLFARMSYGDELVLHFGEQRHGPVRKIKGQDYRYEFGTYSLHTRGSEWVVKSGDKVATSGPTADSEKVAVPIGPRGAADHPPITPGGVVTRMTPFGVTQPNVDGVGLRVDLSDGSAVVVIPTPDEEMKNPPEGVVFSELADWELVTPSGRLEVGPGRKWNWAVAENPAVV